MEKKDTIGKKRLASSKGGFSEHLVAFAIALVLVGTVAFLSIYKWGSLLADITSFSGWTWNQTTDLPVVYEVNNGSLVVKTTKQFVDVDSFSFYVVYDEKNVILQLENAETLYESTYASSSETMILVTLFPKWTIPANTTIYTLPFNGSAEGVTISDATVGWSAWGIEKIAIQKK